MDTLFRWVWVEPLQHGTCPRYFQWQGLRMESKGLKGREWRARELACT